MTKLNKILVVGAGVAGPSVCFWLKKYGFEPTLIENAPAIRKGGQALDIRGVAVPLTRKMGIYEQICDKRTQVVCGRFVDQEGSVIHEEQGEKFGFRQDDEVEIVRGDLVDILMQLIPDVSCFFNRKIDAIDQDEGGVSVAYVDGTHEKYDLVIGADGIHSKTRRLVFDKDEYDVVSLGSYISIFDIPNYLNLHHTEVLCEANEKLASITCDHDETTAQAGFMFRSKQVLNNSRDKSEQMQFLKETFQGFGWEANKLLALMPKSNDFYFDMIAQIKMHEWTKGRVALLGDAGYCASPLSGQGNNLAMVGAYILAGELKACDGDYELAFKRYNELMRPFVDKNQGFGAWVSETYLVSDDVSEQVAKERNDSILRKIKEVSTGVVLPDYA